MASTSHAEVETSDDDYEPCYDGYGSDISGVSLDPDEVEYVPSSMDKTSWDPFLNELVQGELSDPETSSNENDDNENRDGEDEEKDVQFLVHNPRIPWNKMEPHLGEKYETREQFKLCVTNYAVANGFQLRFVKSDQSKILVRCGKKGDKKNQCPFRCFASWMGKEYTLQVKSLEKKHVCGRVYKYGSLVTPSWIAHHYVKKLIRTPKVKVKEMKADFSRMFSLKLSKGQCERGKAIAYTQINGKLVDHYARIWDYAGEILRSNPGSSVEVGVDVNPDAKYFKRIYICFKALKEGWLKGCRKVIDIDGCFLKGQVKGELLAAIGRDGNNQIYPIAWAVVSVENKENWKWFIELLETDIGTNQGRGLTLISDQHKGLLEAVKEIMPHAEHRQCARHVCANFWKRFSGDVYKNKFWEAAMCTTDHDFKHKMEEMKTLNKDAYDHLMQRNPKTWCRAYFLTDRACEAVENGVSESFNSTIVEAREKPLVTMLEEIRLHVMERFDAMRTSKDAWKTDVAPKIIQKMKKWHKHMRWWNVIPSGPFLEVRNGNDGYMVDLGRMSCACRLWDLSGLPCVHACAAINHTHQNLLDYVSGWFKKEKYELAYSTYIVPLNGSSLWVETPYDKLLPPKERSMPGRPAKKRKRDATEKKTKYPSVSGKGTKKKCKNCLEEGHNARTCKNEKIVPPPKEKKHPGRPRNIQSDERPVRNAPPATRGGRGRSGTRGGRGRSGTRGGRSLIDEVLDAPINEMNREELNEVDREDIEMLDTVEEERRRAAMEREEGDPIMHFPESQFDEGVPVTQEDGVPEDMVDSVPETQFYDVPVTWE